MIDKKVEPGLSRAEKRTSDEPLAPKYEKLYYSTLCQAPRKKL